MQQQQYQQLLELIKLSNDMLDLANNKEWSEIEILEKQRKELIDAFFSITHSEGDSAFIAESINDILNINQQLTQIFVENKLDLQAEFSKFKSSQSAKNAYLKNML